MVAQLIGRASRSSASAAADSQTPYRPEQLAAGSWTPVYDLKLGHPWVGRPARCAVATPTVVAVLQVGSCGPSQSETKFYVLDYRTRTEKSNGERPDARADQFTTLFRGKRKGPWHAPRPLRRNAGAYFGSVLRTGSPSVNTLPLPRTLSTVTLPPNSCARCRLTGNPSPVPPFARVRV